MTTELPDIPPEVAWVLPTDSSLPAESLPRIGALCAAYPDLYSALFAVLGTHGRLPRDVLAMAVKHYRADAADLSREDMVALLTSVWNGGRSGFDAVMRSRRKSERKSAALPWASE
jgi:hypothetical protein